MTVTIPTARGWRRRLVQAAVGLVAPAMLTAQATAPSASIVRDVEYGRAGDVSLRLDVGMPTGDGPFPVAILVHGGGWSGGSKAGSDKPGNGADITPWFRTFTDAGVVWFSIDYRLAPTHRWPAALEDVQAAVRWVRAHAAEYHGDPSRLILVGHSAGGQLAVLAAMTADPRDRPQAVIGFAPVTDLVADSERRGGASPSLQGLFGIAPTLTDSTRARLRTASPSEHARAGIPPMLVLHGDADRTVPIGMTTDFCARMVAAGAVCDTIVLPGAPHGLLTWAQFAADYPARIAAWIRTTVPPGPPPRR